MQLHLGLSHPQEAESPGGCCCGCHRGPALYVEPSVRPVPLASASVYVASYSKAHDSPATAGDCRDTRIYMARTHVTNVVTMVMKKEEEKEKKHTLVGASCLGPHL